MPDTPSAPRLPLIALLFSAALLLPACAPAAQAGGEQGPPPNAVAVAPTSHDHGTSTAPSPASPSTADAPNTRNLRIALFQFSPVTAQARVGSPITWTNSDQIEHSVTHGTPAASGGAFDSGLFTQGQHFTFTFTAPGEYPYFCTRHPSMAGLIQVTP